MPLPLLFVPVALALPPLGHDEMAASAQEVLAIAEREVPAAGGTNLEYELTVRVARVEKSLIAEPAPKEQLVVVFKKGTPAAQAQALLAKQPHPFHEGSDSSRGKLYFYRAGPRFLVDVPAGAQEALAKSLRASPLVYEVYRADWNIQKD